MAKYYLFNRKGKQVESAETIDAAKVKVKQLLKRGIEVVYVQDSPTCTQWSPCSSELKSRLF